MLIGFEGKEVPSELSPIAAFFLSFGRNTSRITAPPATTTEKEALARQKNIAILAATQPVFQLRESRHSPSPIYFELLDPARVKNMTPAGFRSLYSATPEMLHTLFKNSTLKPQTDRDYTTQSLAYPAILAIQQAVSLALPLVSPWDRDTQATAMQSSAIGLSLFFAYFLFHERSKNAIEKYNPSIAARPQFNREAAISTIRSIGSLLACLLLAQQSQQFLTMPFFNVTSAADFISTLAEAMMYVALTAIITGAIPSLINVLFNQHHPSDHHTFQRGAGLFACLGVTLALLNSSDFTPGTKNVVSNILLGALRLAIPIQIACGLGATPAFPGSAILNRVHAREPENAAERHKHPLKLDGLQEPGYAAFWQTFETNSDTFFESSTSPKHAGQVHVTQRHLTH